MKRNEVVKHVVEEIYPDDYLIVGEETIDMLITNENEDALFYKPEGGNDFDFTTTLTLISTCVIIAKNTIEIIEKLKAQNKVLNEEKIKTELENKVDKSTLQSGADIGKIVNKIYQLF